MAEYIEREAAIAALQEVFGDAKHEGVRLSVAVKMVLSSKSIPAADVAPVRHGRWVFVEQRFYHGGFVNLFRGSECKVATDTDSNYCPNCGAKMDLEGGNT